MLFHKNLTTGDDRNPKKPLRKSTINSWQDFNYQGQVYSLSHLNSFRHTFVQQAKGKNPERLYKVDVEFSSHCFTKGLKQDTLANHPEDLHYSDDRETRIFCFDRHELSKRLPGIIREIDLRKCFHTGKSNFLTIEFIDENEQKQQYEVYFVVTKKDKGVLRLFIQSAYPRDPTHIPEKKVRRKPVGFYILLHNTLKGKPTRMPR